MNKRLTPYVPFHHLIHFCTQLFSTRRALRDDDYDGISCTKDKTKTREIPPFDNTRLKAFLEETHDVFLDFGRRRI